MGTTFENLRTGDAIDGPKFAVSRESIRLFCDASLDYNPLHLDDEYMKGDFGKTNFGGIIMHGMNNFGLISRMITDWAYPAGAVHRRLETRWVKPVRPGESSRRADWAGFPIVAGSSPGMASRFALRECAHSISFSSLRKQETILRACGVSAVIASQRVARMRPMTGSAKQSILQRKERVESSSQVLLAMTLL